jgi:hydrogenase maturation protein HypF
MSTASTISRVRQRLVVRGVVQGVGFRPFVARLATELGLGGYCFNDAVCVTIEVEGPGDLVAAFRTRLENEAPPLARILSVEGAEFTAAGQTSFTIRPSRETPGQRTMVPPDTAVCADCLRELRDAANRRYRHPFITCTNCGPRFTITRDLPYDRATTTMASFPMCPACAREYADPTDRRYHAQPIGCHDCGPALWLTELGEVGQRRLHRDDALDRARTLLADGGIVAVKGLGGYHLAVDAQDGDALARLRERKHRPAQPFAVMVRDLVVATQIVHLDNPASRVLARPDRPIVVLPARPEAVSRLVAPGLDELGVMLPYTPLHHLLLGSDFDRGPTILVMTSGNRTGEPICYDDEDALSRLNGIADAVLGHDREIAVPCDDSVVAWSPAGPVPIRRSRGQAPLPVGDAAATRVVLAAGAEVKNTFALTRDRQVFLSAHVGDLGSLESRAAYQQATDQLLGFHGQVPELVAADMHPGYASRAWAEAFAQRYGVPVYDVQHHHAHLAALAVEHERMDQEILGVVFDGTGFGCDATVWGGELLLLTDGGLTARRLGRLGMIPLPGGDAGVRNPVRTAAAAMLAYGLTLDGSPVAEQLTGPEREAITSVMAGTTGWVPTSSVGRLFDVVSAMLGIRSRVSYEAQAAIELEVTAARRQRDLPGVESTRLALGVREQDEGVLLDPAPLLTGLDSARRSGVDAGELALAFHRALAEATAAAVVRLAASTGVRSVGLSGGVLCNRILLADLGGRLRSAGLDVLTHRSVPANDGGLALGQAAVAVRALERDRTTALEEVL